MSKLLFYIHIIEIQNILFTCCLLFYTIILRYKDISQKKSNNQLSRSEQWGTYALTVDIWLQDSLVWIKDYGQKNIDHHNILAGWCLSLSQRFLIMFTKVCDELSTKLSVTHFGELLAMIGIDASDKRVCSRCGSRKSPDGDLIGDIRFLLLLVWNSFWIVK